MKTRNQFSITAMALLAAGIAAVTLAITACPSDSGSPAHTHTWSATWANDANQHWHECTAGDGAKANIANHTPGEWITDTPATLQTDGARHKECTLCRHTTEQEAIPPCRCEDKKHLGIDEPCPCGRTPCDCELKVYGSIVDDNSKRNYNIPIYRNGEITDTQMATAVTNIIAGYNSLDDTSKDMLKDKIDEIQVIADSTYFYRKENGKLIVGIRSDRSLIYIRTIFDSISNNSILPTIVDEE